VLLSAAVGVVAFAVALALSPWQAAVLVGWDAAAAVALAWMLLVMWGKGPAATAAWATREDDSHTAADLLLIATGVASLGAVAFGLVKSDNLHGGAKAGLTAAATLGVVLAWAVLHAVYTLRYARLFYSEHGGLDINEERQPDYHDFLYVAFTIGMTYQVSDTAVRSKSMRRAILGHALLSYLYGTAIVAMTINIVAGLVR
jgi:uncharacterized membrane protein